MKLSSILESLLFIAGEPVKIKKLAKFAGASESEARSALLELGDAYERERGLRLLVKDDEAEIVTHPDASSRVAEYLQSGMDEDLTGATSETLAIVAYRGPLTRAAIDDIRGVNSVYTLRSLLIRGLVERIPHPEDSRTYLYRISFDFLKKLGLKDGRDLPEFDRLSSLTLTPPASAPEESKNNPTSP